MILVQTFVAGLPRTKGSLAKRPNGTLYDSVVDSGKWRALMAGALRGNYQRNWQVTGDPAPPYAGAVSVSASFTLPVDPLAFGAGDLDKLVRNLLDALGTRSKNPRFNGGVIEDDNQVTDFGRVKKRGPCSPLGILVRVETVDENLATVPDAW